MSVVKCPSCGADINVTDQKTTMWWGVGCLIAAVAIPIIVAIIGLLAAIAIPSFVRAREVTQLRLCVNNMRLLSEAKEHAATAKNLKPGDPVAEQDVSPLLPRGLSGLVCPRGGRYTINPVGQDPACSVHGPLSTAGQRRPGAEYRGR